MTTDLLILHAMITVGFFAATSFALSAVFYGRWKAGTIAVLNFLAAGITAAWGALHLTNVLANGMAATVPHTGACVLTTALLAILGVERSLQINRNLRRLRYSEHVKDVLKAQTPSKPASARQAARAPSAIPARPAK